MGGWEIITSLVKTNASIFKLEFEHLSYKMEQPIRRNRMYLFLNWSVKISTHEIHLAIKPTFNALSIPGTSEAMWSAKQLGRTITSSFNTEKTPTCNNLYKITPGGIRANIWYYIKNHLSWPWFWWISLEAVYLETSQVWEPLALIKAMGCHVNLNQHKH